MNNMNENNNSTDHNKFMRAALKEAQKAFDKEECPIGCVIVKDGKIIARGHNLKVTQNNALKHAEMVAINKASRKLGDWRLTDCDMYVTLEPCTMCSGAIIQSRIRKVFFGAYDPKGGAVASCNDIFDLSHGHNHLVAYEGGVLQEDCATLLKEFFRSVRKRNNLRKASKEDS